MSKGQQLNWQKYWWLLAISVVILAAVLRLYKLGEVPHGLAWDEAAIGYNGYAVFTKRRDEWLVRLPISFKSFGDYKAPLSIYLNGPFTWSLGMHPWVVRLPFALAGVAAVAGWMVLIYLLWPSDGELHRKQAVLLGGTLLAFSPWHLHFSRLAFESGLALTCLIWGVVGLVWLTRVTGAKYGWRTRLAATLLMVISLSASFYAYHSAKLVTPLVCLVLALWFWRPLLRAWRWCLAAVALGLVLMKPLLVDTFWGFGGERFAQASVLSKGLGTGAMLVTVWQQFLVHLQPSFLVLGATTSLRHSDGQWGVLLPLTYLTMMVGLVVGWWWRKGRGWWWLMASWFAIGLLPAAIGVDVPHSNRSLLAVIGALGLAMTGIDIVLSWLKSQAFTSLWPKRSDHAELVSKSVWGMGILLYFLMAFSYLHHYYTGFARDSAADFSDGYIQAFQAVVPYEKGTNGHKVDKVLFSSRYGQPYIYALFVRRTDPIWYQGGSLNTYEFTDHIGVGDLDRPNTIVVATPADGLPTDKADQIVYGSNHEPRFLIYGIPK